MPQDEQGSGSATALMVWCTDRDAAAPMLEALRTRFVLDFREDLSAVDPEQGGTEAILFYRSLGDVLQRAADDGADPEQAVMAWQAQIRAILALHRHNRRRIRLVETGAARAHAAAFRRAFGLPGDIADPPDGPPVQDGMLAFLARHYLLDDPEGRALNQALEAASVGLAPPAEGLTAAATAFLAYRRQREESGILREQSRAMQEELETLNRDREALAQALEAAAEAERRAEERIAQLQSRGDTLEAENARVQDRADRLEAERAQAHSRANALEEELLQVRNHADSLREDLAQAQSRGEILEREHARLQDEAASAAERAGLQIELLQAQTRAMQDELETMAARSRDMDTRMRQLDQGLENYRSRIDELRERQTGLHRKLAAKEQSLIAAGRALANLETHGLDLRRGLTRSVQDHDRTRTELDGVRSALETARAEMRALEAEMARLMRSRSFRLTAPLRRVAALFSGGSRS